MGMYKVNCNLASHVQDGDTTGDYRFICHKGETSAYSESPGMTSTERDSVVSAAQTSQGAMETALPTAVETWYSNRATDGIRLALYYAAKQY